MYVLDRHDTGNDTLVAAATGHLAILLVQRLNTTLDCDIGRDHLQHTRGQLVALSYLALLDLEVLAEFLPHLLDLHRDGLQLAGGLFVAKSNLQPLALAIAGFDVVEVALGDLVPGPQRVWIAIDHLSDQHLLDALEGILLHDPQLVGEVFANALQLDFLDMLRALILLDTFADEDLHIHDSVLVGARVLGQL